MKDTVNIDTRPTKDDVFAAKVEKREDRPVLVPLNPRAWLAALGRIVGEHVIVKIERPKLRRSGQQNAYYWGIVLVDVLSGLRALAVSVRDECSVTSTKHLHTIFKALFLPIIVGPNVVRMPGAGADVELMPDTTTVLTKAQYALYIDHIIRWASDRAVPVRSPGEEVFA